MRKLLKLLIILFFTSCLCAEPKYESRFGLLSEGTILTSFKDARIALKVWLEDVSLNYDTKLNIKFHDNSNTLYRALKNSELDMIVVDLPFFFKNKADIMSNCHNFWSLKMTSEKYTQYYLIGKKILKAKSFKDTKGRSISLKDGDIGAKVWLDKNSLLENHKTSNKVVKKILLKKKESTAILNVFFNKSDFAVIRKETWDIVSELNPSIKNKIEVISESKKIHIPFIGLFSKDAKGLTAETFFKIGNNLNNLRGSNQIIEVLKFNSLFKVDSDYLENLNKYYSEYFNLKMKYK